jgi:hypothetical protein
MSPTNNDTDNGDAAIGCCVILGAAFFLFIGCVSALKFILWLFGA